MVIGCLRMRTGMEKLMRFEEVLPSFREGKKIRRECWMSNRDYFQLQKRGVRDQDNMTVGVISISSLLAVDWELWQPPESL